MEKIDWTSFTRKINIAESKEKVYQFWARAPLLEKWFLEKASYKTDGIAHMTNAQAKDTYEWKWYNYDIIEKGKVLAANGIDTFEFSFAGECRVSVHLETLESETIVTLQQSNIPTDEKSMKNIRMGCDSGWSFYLVNLKSVLESGKDLRNKNDALKGLLNN